jgi:TrmH family RNA methyltransferase
MKTISSLHNDTIKSITGLILKASLRKKSNVFVVEGKRELQLAHKGGFTIDTVFCCPALFKPTSLAEWSAKNLGTRNIILVTENVYEKISYRKKTEGIIALVKKKTFDLDSIVFKNPNPLILVVENIEKPGNIGAMLRTADASKVDCLLVADPKTDIYNPNVVRSSVGGFFTVPIGLGSNNDIHEFLQRNQITSYAASLQDSISYEKIDFSTPTAVVVGTESTGLSAFWTKESKSNIKIPMLGTLDSMNVSVAAAIILFEATRQRNFYRDIKGI